MVALRERMQERYAGWREDLPEETGWPDFFNGCPNPGFATISAERELEDNAPVWPGRRNAPHEDGPEGVHICRAFDHIEPADVRVIVLGEVPYPSISSATGRAFEDGTPDAAGEALKVALRVLGQSVLDLHGEACPAGFCHGQVGRAAAIRNRFDRLAEEGVLCLNAAWTFTEENHKSAHLRLWKPVMAYLLQRLIERPDGAPVLLLLGIKAQRFFDGLTLPNVPQEAVVRSHHLSERKNEYFAGPNPLQRVNEALLHLGKDPITWWPPAEPGA